MIVILEKTKGIENTEDRGRAQENVVIGNIEIEKSIVRVVVVLEMIPAVIAELTVEVNTESLEEKLITVPQTKEFTAP